MREIRLILIWLDTCHSGYEGGAGGPDPTLYYCRLQESRIPNIHMIPFCFPNTASRVKILANPASRIPCARLSDSIVGPS